jgi:biopolymer transport protein ExbD
MRTPSNLARGSVGFNMTPMIDVVFLLIIFFLVSSHLARQEVQTELDLPTARSGQRPSEDQVRRVVVNVLPEAGPEGRFMVSGKRMPSREVARMIGFESGRSEGRLEVRIRTDRSVPYQAVEPVMVACAKAGVWKVTFAVTRQ